MRIITGSAGGIPLAVPKSVTRPTQDRVREAVFSILADRVPDAVVADLFAGTGSYGLECLSRGAKSCLFVEADRAASEVTGRNLEKTRLKGGKVLNSSVDAWLKGRGRSTAERMDLIFADPPWVKQRGDRDYAAELLKSELLPDILAPDGLLILESRAGENLIAAAPPAPWRMLDERRYGDSAIHFLTTAPA